MLDSSAVTLSTKSAVHTLKPAVHKIITLCPIYADLL